LAELLREPLTSGAGELHRGRDHGDVLPDGPLLACSRRSGEELTLQHRGAYRERAEQLVPAHQRDVLTGQRPLERIGHGARQLLQVQTAGCSMAHRPSSAVRASTVTRRPATGVARPRLLHRLCTVDPAVPTVAPWRRTTRPCP